MRRKIIKFSHKNKSRTHTAKKLYNLLNKITITSTFSIHTTPLIHTNFFKHILTFFMNKFEISKVCITTHRPTLQG